MKIISKPPTYIFLCSFLSVTLYYFFPKANLVKSPFNYLGIILIFFGIFLVMWSWKVFVKNKTPENFERPKCVVNKGVYKFSRNPMYLGIIISLIGLSLFLGNIISFISPVIFFIIMNWMFIPYEEKMMEKEFGKKYLEYKKKVRRWI